MKYELRDYQREASDCAVRFFRSKDQRNGLIILPTGSGKSLVIADIAYRLDGNVLVFQPSKEILEQNYSKLRGYGVEDCSIYSASLSKKEISRITFATIGSVMSHMEDFDHFSHIIIDECHLVNAEGGMYKKFISKVKRKVLGLTATPYRLYSSIQYTDKEGKQVFRPREPQNNTAFDKMISKIEERERRLANPELFSDSPLPDPVKMTSELSRYIEARKAYAKRSVEFENCLFDGSITSENKCILKFLTRMKPRMFHDVLYQADISVLLQRGYLAKLNYFDLQILDQGSLKRNTTGMDFDDKFLFSEYQRVNLNDYLVSIVRRLQNPKNGIPRKGILVFTRFLEESEYLCSKIPGCAMVSGTTTKKERERILSEFKSGKIQVVANVGVLTTGFDHPELDTIVMARPTMSLALWYQIVGRAIRPHPSKECAWIVDLCGNIKRFGRVEDLHLTEPKTGEYIIQGFADGGWRQLTNTYF